MKTKLPKIGLILTITVLAVSANATEPESASYRLKQSTLNATAEISSAAGYALTGALGNELTVGTSSSPSFVLQSGFWSFLGSGLVPVLLAIDKNPLTPGNVDLTWSGNNPPYEIYQATDCTNVFTSLLDTTSANSYDDIAPPGGTLICYSVLATAPG